MKTNLILIADDEPDINSLVTEELMAKGYEIISCLMAKDALLLLSEGLKPTGILVDLVFPDMDSDDLLNSLIKIIEQEKIVLVSGRLDIEDWAKKYGITKTLSKPFQMEDLLQAVGSFK
jgi:DNA-binding NtrC family response regulator